MSKELQKPKLAGEPSVNYCPFCGLGKFEEPLETNKEIECSTEIGGCGKKFSVREF